MTKEEILQLYISDLKNIVSKSPARDSRILQLEEELSNLSNVKYDISVSDCEHKHIMWINSDIEWLCLVCRKMGKLKQTKP